MLPLRKSVFVVTLGAIMMTKINLASGDNSFCSKPLDPGPCRMALPTWGYQCKSKECTKFMYGGCKGNENNFESKEACEAACQNAACPKRRKRQVRQPDQCIYPADTGTCRKHNITKWAYDCGDKECQEFTYGGCGGNANKFDSKDDCEEACEETEACPEPETLSSKKSTTKKPKNKVKNSKPISGKDKKVSFESASDEDDDFSSDSAASSESISREHTSASSEEGSSEEEDDQTKTKDGKKTIQRIKKKRQRKIHRKRKNTEVRHEKNRKSRKSSKS